MSNGTTTKKADDFRSSTPAKIGGDGTALMTLALSVDGGPGKSPVSVGSANSPDTVGVVKAVCVKVTVSDRLLIRVSTTVVPTATGLGGAVVATATPGAKFDALSQTDLNLTRADKRGLTLTM